MRYFYCINLNKFNDFSDNCCFFAMCDNNITFSIIKFEFMLFYVNKHYVFSNL